MDTQYTVVMDPDDVRLEPVEIDYEANTGDGFRERKLSDSFEPLEVRSWCISVPITCTVWYCRETIRGLRLINVTSGSSAHIRYA